MEEFKVECDLRRLSPRTTKGYYNNTASFLNYLEKHEAVTQLELIRHQHIKKYIQYLLAKNLSPSYINGILKCLRAFFKYAHGEEYISVNPATKVNWQREGKVLIETFTDEEVESLLSVFDFSTYLSARNKLILAIAFDTGARNTEICDILEEDIRDNVILIHGKGNKERHTLDGQSPYKVAGEKHSYGVYNLNVDTIYTIILENSTDSTLSFSMICTPNPSPKDLRLTINMTESDTMYWNDNIDSRGYGARLYYEPAYAYITDTVWSSSDENVLSIEATGSTNAAFIVRNTGITTITATMKDGTTVSMALTIMESPEFGEEKNGVEKTITLRNNANYYYFTPKESGYYDFRAWHKYGAVQGEITYRFLPMTEDCVSVERESYSYHRDYFSSVYRLEAGTKYIVEAHHSYDELLEAVLQIVKTNDPTGADESNPIDINKPTEPEETEPTEPEDSEPTEPAPTEPEETEPTEPVPTEPEETEPTEPAPTEPEETKPTEPPCEHEWSKWNVTAPTSKKEGKRTRECELCGEVEQEVLSKLSGEFQDVKDTEYYALPVDWAVQNKITNGVAEGKFGPDQDCTRGQIVTFLWRAAGEPEPTSTSNPFQDVKKDDYFYKAVLWAVENEITTGVGNGKFDPGASCTRAQVATFLWRSQGKPTATGSNPFGDVKKGEYYYEAVIWAVENGVTTGTSATTFEPEKTCTRGQIVTFLYRAFA